MSAENSSETGERTSYTIARRAAESVSKFPHLFTSAIRVLTNEWMAGVLGGDEAPDKSARRSVDFLLRCSPTLRAMLYFAGSEIHSDKLSKLPTINRESLITLFSASEIASIIGLTLLYRKLRRECDAEEWKFWMEKLPVHMKIASIVGDTFSKVSVGGGMLAGGMRFIAGTVFLRHDQKKFQDFRRKLKTSNRLFNLEAERALWGCDHLEIASSLVQTLRFGVGPGMAFGMEPPNRNVGQSEEEFSKLEEFVISFQGTICWSESLHETGKAPSGIGKNDVFYLPEDITEELQSRVANVVKEEKGLTWLERSLSELPQEVAEKLEVNAARDDKEGIEEEVS